MKLATTLALLAVTLTVLADGPATIRYSFQKDDGTPLAGATIRITPSSTNLQGYSGSVLVPSGKQIVLGSDGKATNQMMVGFYSLQVPAAGHPIGFQVPDTTNSYDFTALVTQGLSAFQYSPLVTQITSRDGSIVITPGNGRGPVDLSVVGGSGGGGTNGVNGTNGLAATISVGTVTTGAAGSSAAVVNTGTSNAAVFAFTIPRGDTGAQGPQGVAGANGADGAQGPQGIPGPVTDFPYTRITNAPWLTPSAADLRYDALNAAHDATNSLGSAAFKATGYFDAAGAGTAAAHDATNTYPWGVLYDAAGAAASAQTASLPLHGTADLALGLYGFTAATNGGPVAGSQVTGPTSTTNGLLSSANAAATYLGLHAKADTAGNADTVTSISGNTVSSSQITTGLGFTPISGNQNITLSGDATGSGTTSITVTATNLSTGGGSAGQLLTKTASGVAWSNTPAATIGTSGASNQLAFLAYNGTSWVSAQPEQTFSIVEDFLANSASPSETGFIIGGTGAGCGNSMQGVVSGHPGVAGPYITPNASPGYQIIAGPGISLAHGSGSSEFIEWLVEPRIALSSGTNLYAMWIGWFAQGSGSYPTDGVWFQHDATTNTWQMVLGKGSTYNTNYSNVAITLNNWFKLGARVDAATNTVFYINGSSIYTNSNTALSTGANCTLKFVIQSSGSGGNSTPIQPYVDYCFFTQTLGTSR